MIAYHGKDSVKKKYLTRVQNHRKADEIIKDTYWEKGKGCAVGCTIHSGNHADYETELGIPRVLARLEDGIFEALPNDLAQTWPERFLKAIKPGADLSQVWTKFAVWLLNDPQHGVVKYAKTERSTNAINHISNLYLRSLKEEVTHQQWVDARRECYAAAYDAAAYAAAYAAYAADAAAYAAAYAAYAADAAYADAAAYARTKARVIQSEKLLELLKECKRPTKNKQKATKK